MGLAPYWVRPKRGFAEYQLLGAGSAHRLAPVAVSGREAEVADAVARTLAAADPRPSTVRVDATDVDTPWPAALARAWPGPFRPWVRTDRVLSAPVLELRGRSFDDWMGEKSKNFRQQMRGGRRKLEKAGAVVRMSDLERLPADLSALSRLHHSRWSDRGGSSVMDQGIERLLLDAGRALIPEERFRLWMIEVDGVAISAHLFLAAGGEAAYWNGGFDEEWSQYKPALQALLSAVEDACARGDHRVDFGGGAQPYKRRFADSDAPIAWYTLFPRDARYPLTRARTLPRHARWRARELLEKLPDDQRRRLKRMAGRDRGGES